MTEIRGQRPSPLVAAARSLAVDAVTAEVATAWRAAGVDSLLIKGPTIARWLYDETRVRSYGDSDLFVAPSHLARARAVLAELGFEERPYDDPELSTHATPWLRPRDGAQVDLHHALWGASAPPQRQWEVLHDGFTETMRVANADVTVPSASARALLVAAHAAQHAAKAEEKPREDLTRALAAADEQPWCEAAELADRLGAVAALATGLSRHPAGLELARRLPYTRAWMRGHGLTRTGAVGFERVVSAHGGRARTATALRTLFPPPDVMRWWSPLARRGRRGLAAAYAVRLTRLGVQVGPSLASWLRARGARTQ